MSRWYSGRRRGSMAASAREESSARVAVHPASPAWRWTNPHGIRGSARRRLGRPLQSGGGRKGDGKGECAATAGSSVGMRGG
jgi:hypothetical protein